MEIDYLGVDPAKKDFRQVRKFNIGKIYLINKRAGRNEINLAEAIGEKFGVTGLQVIKCSKFSLKCRHRGMIIGTPYKCEWFETSIDPEAHEARRIDGLKKSQKKAQAVMKSRKHEGKRNAIAYKGGACSCCGIAYNGENAAIFDFHHRNPKTKELNIGQSLESPMEVLKAELDKCDLVCSNCHRLIHHRGL